jgi:conjugal transfer pilus assembly protein TraV
MLMLTLGGCAGHEPRPSSHTDSRQATGVLESLQAYQPQRGQQNPKSRPVEHRAAGDQRAAKATAEAPSASEAAPLPSREPAQIMRLWIAPWEDAAGNLHGASHVFLEITPRRWRLASAPDAPDGPVLTPLQLEPRTAPRTDHTPNP